MKGALDPTERFHGICFFFIELGLKRGDLILYFSQLPGVLSRLYDKIPDSQNAQYQYNEKPSHWIVLSLEGLSRQIRERVPFG
jgi:hypothetical protein